MGEVARYVLTSDELLRRIVSFHSHNWLDFFRHDRADLFWIRHITIEEIQEYIETRMETVRYHRGEHSIRFPVFKFNIQEICQPEIDYNSNRYATNIGGYYMLHYRIGGMGHEGYCPGNEAEEIEPREVWTIIAWHWPSPPTVRELTKEYNFHPCSALNEFIDHGSRFCNGETKIKWEPLEIIKVA